MRTWACSFEYDATNDVIFAYPCGRLCTPEEAAEAYTEIGSHYAAYGRKVDVIVLIDMWSVDDHVDHRESRMWLMSHVRNMVVVSHDTTSTGRMADRLDDDTPSFGEAHDVATALRMIKESRAKDVRFAG
jgi:hypothetical protein